MIRELALASLVLLPAGAAAMDLSAASAANYRVPISSLKEIRFKSTQRQQYDFSCGSAALATLLTYHYGHVVSEIDIFERMFAQGDQGKIRNEGFSLLDMRRYLVGIGFAADGFEQPLQKLVDANLPAIVLISEKGYHHFVVIKGSADGRVLLGDPSAGTRSVSRKHFEELWANKLLFVIHGYKDRPLFNLASDWRAAPPAPLAQGINRAGLELLTMPKFGPGDF